MLMRIRVARAGVSRCAPAHPLELDSPALTLKLFFYSLLDSREPAP